MENIEKFGPAMSKHEILEGHYDVLIWEDLEPSTLDSVRIDNPLE